MAWPTVTIDTTAMDAGTDNPANARAQIKQMADNVNDMKNASATSTLVGPVELATPAETQAGADSIRAVTPFSLQSKVSSTTAIGLIELATQAEADTGTDSGRAIAPSTLQGKVNFKKMFSGLVSSAGALTQPAAGISGWSFLKLSPGNYLITHNLGALTYSVQATSNGGAAPVCSLGSHNTNTFSVNTRDVSGTLTDSAFFFVVNTY